MKVSFPVIRTNPQERDSFKAIGEFSDRSDCDTEIFLLKKEVSDNSFIF